MHSGGTLRAAAGCVLQGDCSDDNCCEEGNYNTGVVVARRSGDVYVANECPAGRVLHFDGTGSLVGGAAISVGTFPASISVRHLVIPRRLQPAALKTALRCRAACSRCAAAAVQRAGKTSNV